MYKIIFKKVYSPWPEVFLSTLGKAIKGHKPAAALGFTSTLVPKASDSLEAVP